jgi:hypothetical protein
MNNLDQAKRDELTAWVVLQDASARAVEAYRNGLDLAPYLPDIQAARDEWNRVLVIRLRAEEREREEEKLRRIEEEMKARPVTMEEINAEATPRERRTLIDLGYVMAEVAIRGDDGRVKTVSNFNELKDQIAARVVQKRLAAHEALARIRDWNRKNE